MDEIPGFRISEFMASIMLNKNATIYFIPFKSLIGGDLFACITEMGYNKLNKKQQKEMTEIIKRNNEIRS